MTQTKIAVGMVDASGTPGSGNFLRGDGAWNAAGAWNLIGTSVASSSASLTITGLDSTYDTYAIGLSDILPSTDNVGAYIRVGDSSGVDSASSDYQWAGYYQFMSDATFSAAGEVDNADAQIKLTFSDLVGSGTGEGFGGMLYLHRPGDATMQPMITGHTILFNGSANVGFVGAKRNAVITLDRIQFLMSSGNVASGRMTVWGIAHA
jgi:hypothetical protein